jgi:serine/threonine protein phosphatase PrpC
MKFAVYQSSHIGGRKYNQDLAAHAYTEHALLLVLADGMGGHLHGEVAAQIAIHTYTQAFMQAAQPQVQNPDIFLRDVMQQAHDAIVHFARAQKLDGSPGTTCVAALVQDGQAHWAHAGDSRLYLLREGQVAAVTHDHSMVQQWTDWGIISPAEMKTHPERNKITNCLGGVEDMFFVEASQAVPLLDGDTLLLCSDGLWSPLQDEEIAAGLGALPLPAGLSGLMDTALRRDGPRADNTTAIAMRWGGGEQEQAAPQPVCVILDTQRDNPESELLGRTLPSIRNLNGN